MYKFIRMFFCYRKLKDGNIKLYALKLIYNIIYLYKMCSFKMD